MAEESSNAETQEEISASASFASSADGGSARMSEAPMLIRTSWMRRGCFRRWFGEMGLGSVRASMLSLAVTAIGGGVLALPYVCTLCGLILGLIMLVLGYFAALWSFHMIIAANSKMEGVKSFKAFCMNTSGRKLVLVYNITVILTVYGVLTGYQVIISGLIQRVLTTFEVKDPKDYRYIHIILLSAVAIFPLTLLRTTSNLRYATILSLIAIAYTTIILVIELPIWWINGKVEGELELFKLNWQFFNAFGITFFAFFSQSAFYSAIETLTKRDTPHLKSITTRAVTIDLVFYVIITLAGYLATLNKTKDVIIDRGSPYEGKDYPLTIAQLLLCISLTIAIPLNYVYMRAAIFELIFTDPHYTFKRAIIISIIFTTSTCLLAIVIPNISTILSIVGGFGCVIMAYIIPSIAYLRIGGNKPLTGYIFIAIASTLCAIGFGSAINAILNQF